ncbi:F0F1 ATP synthase subunit B [Actinomarinicola tropica]|uniref:ATP synthase subunit b n=1 Tax=Actinomarinicola tropica TaxID=2789776 RepID=A0A5Q2RCI1_9ACTN|nr:F0F1 ATP synthase subunit B [Actinomarinicola tropica]QGG94599.1 F0F1 ATP synthase subunit B [Actinomarinicola tropica]
MRIRTALAAVLLLVVATLGFASPAGAAESIGSCVAEVAAEVNALMEEGMSEYDALQEVEGQAEGCVEAPNPVLPELNELIWIGIAFIVLLALGMKFAYPAVASAMEARSEKIRSDLEAAERTRLDAEAEAEKYRASLGDAQAESARILDEARTSAESVRAERLAAAESEAAEIKAKAVADAEQIKAQALADLRSEVVALAVGAAEQVVQRNLDAAAQAELIENYINQVGSQN